MTDPRAAQTASGPEHQASLQALRARSQGLRALLADPNPASREHGTRLLAAAGMQVDAVEDATAVMDKSARGAYDLVLMDAEIAQEDGRKAARHLRTLAGYRSVPVLAMTSSAQFTTARRSCLAAGVHEVVRKPVDRDSLYAALLEWLPQQPPQSSHAAPAQEPAEARPIEDRLASIDGLDYPQALTMAMGRTDFLVRLLGLFITARASDAAKLRQLHAAGDHEALERLAHGIKGSAATLAVTRVAELAVRVQSDAGQAGGAAEEDVAQLAEALENFIASVNAALAPSPA